MPTVAIVDGILIVLYPNDHDPPHFHARASDFDARIRIEDGTIIDSDGRVDGRSRRRLKAWTLKHRDALMGNWSRLRRGEAARWIAAD